MKNTLLTFAAIAMIFSFTSCKETTVESTEDTEVEVLETETETPEEVIETPTEEVVDTTTISEEATLVE